MSLSEGGEADRLAAPVTVVCPALFATASGRTATASLPAAWRGIESRRLCPQFLDDTPRDCGHTIARCGVRKEVSAPYPQMYARIFCHRRAGEQDCAVCEPFCAGATGGTTPRFAVAVWRKDACGFATSPRVHLREASSAKAVGADGGQGATSRPAEVREKRRHGEMRTCSLPGAGICERCSLGNR